jgi:hypothetical protein
MDPLGAVVSAVELARLALDYFKGVKNAQDDIRQLTESLDQLGAVISDLKARNWPFCVIFIFKNLYLGS